MKLRRKLTPYTPCPSGRRCSSTESSGCAAAPDILGPELFAYSGVFVPIFDEQRWAIGVVARDALRASSSGTRGCPDCLYSEMPPRGYIRQAADSANARVPHGKIAAPDQVVRLAVWAAAS